METNKVKKPSARSASGDVGVHIGQPIPDVKSLGSAAGARPTELEASITAIGDSRQIRRKLTGIGLGAPVLMTLLSRPAFGGQCLSNMMSGNLSSPDRGHCGKGWSPGAWQNPGGTISGNCTMVAYQKAGFVYATKYKNGSTWVSIAAGTCGPSAANTVFKGGSVVPAGIPNPNNWPTIRELLKNDNGSAQWHLMAAYLNAKLGESSTSDSFMYILSSAQVLALAQGTQSIPLPYTSLNSFLDSTWT